MFPPPSLNCTCCPVVSWSMQCTNTSSFMSLDYVYTYILLWILATPACGRPLVANCGRARPPNVAIQSWLPDQRRNPATGVFLPTPQPCQCSARATGSIAELSIYLIIRAVRLPRGCTSTGPVRTRARCKQLAPFAIAERLIIAKPRRTRLSYRLLKTS